MNNGTVNVSFSKSLADREWKCDECTRVFPKVRFGKELQLLRCLHNGKFEFANEGDLKASLRAEGRDEKANELAKLNEADARKLVEISDQLYEKKLKKRAASKAIVDVAKRLDFKVGIGAMAYESDTMPDMGDDNDPVDSDF